MYRKIPKIIDIEKLIRKEKKERTIPATEPEDEKWKRDQLYFAIPDMEILTDENNSEEGDIFF